MTYILDKLHCFYSTTLKTKIHTFGSMQMSETLNQKSSIQGKVPSGYFNSMFDLSGDWFHDAADANYLAFDGYFIALYYLHLTASPLVLQDEVKKAVPSNWDPASLARYFLDIVFAFSFNVKLLFSFTILGGFLFFLGPDILILLI